MYLSTIVCVQCVALKCLEISDYFFTPPLPEAVTSLMNNL